MRVFYALTFYEETKYVLSQYRDEIASHCASGNFTKRHNFHLTLEFIGEVDYQTQERLCDLLYELEVIPKQLILDGIGSFKKKKDILWFGVAKNDDLMALHKALAQRLRDEGFELENRHYKPHITIGRQVTDFINDASIYIDALEMPIKSIALMESKRIDGRLVYQPIEEINII